MVSRLATIDQIEVCPLSRGMMFQSLSESLQLGIRFLYPPMPTPPTVFLTVHLPDYNNLGDDLGFPRSLLITRLG
ncbi:hypothetical protein [Undibacterium danionis]